MRAHHEKADSGRARDRDATPRVDRAGASSSERARPRGIVFRRSSVALAAGTRLGPYEILSPIGAGGMGEVYAARDTRLDRRVAIKVLAAELASDAAHLARFQREAKAASSLNNPNIVTVYDVGVSESVSWVAMELVEGKSLGELIAEGPLPARKLLDLAGQIADGLAAAHDAGIVHRDLKPANVMITREGLVKVVDFGLARAFQRDAGERTQATTETSASDAHRRHRRHRRLHVAGAGARGARRFSVGPVLASDPSSTRWPRAGAHFKENTRIDTLSAVLHDDPEPIARLRPGIPPPLRWVVERCHAKAAGGPVRVHGRPRPGDSRDPGASLGGVRERGPGRAAGASASSGSLAAVASPRVARGRRALGGAGALAPGSERSRVSPPHVPQRRRHARALHAEVQFHPLHGVLGRSGPRART